MITGNCITGSIRLVGGETEAEGRLEMCINREWGTVCGHDQWTNESTAVVCRQLGYSPDGGYYELLAVSYHITSASCNTF